MKFIMSLLFATVLVLSMVNAFPSSGKILDDDTEIVVVPLERQHNLYRDPEYNNFQGIVDTGYGPQDSYYPQSGYFSPVSQYNPFNWNFGRFFESFEDVLRRMRDQVSTSWSNIPSPSIPGGFWSSGLPEGKGNTTSTIKIIDGHKVIINDTVYKQDSEFGTSIVKVRVIDVKPLDDDLSTNQSLPADVPTILTEENTDKKHIDETDVQIKTKIDTETETETETETTVPTTTMKIDEKPLEKDNSEQLEKGSPEELDNSSDNEISKEIDEPSAEENIDQHLHNNLHNNVMHQRFKESPEFYYHDEFNHQSHQSPNWESFEYVNNDNDNNIDEITVDDHQYQYQYPIDLSNDIYVNQLLANQGAMKNPDAESFSVEEIEPISISASSSSSSTSTDYFSSPKQPIK